MLPKDELESEVAIDNGAKADDWTVGTQIRRRAARETSSISPSPNMVGILSRNDRFHDLLRDLRC